MSAATDTLVRANLPPIEVTEVPIFVAAIEEIRCSLSFREWRRFCAEDIHLKQWVKFLCEEPYTCRALAKPRGYAGDAVMMDLAYDHPSCATTIAASSQTGQLINRIVVKAAMSVSVRARVKLIADEITRFAAAGPINVASFASGHGRELEQVGQHCRANIQAFYAIDSDALSLTALSYDNGHAFSIVPIKRNVFRIRSGELPALNLAYSLGLFDYLEAKAAGRLVEAMASMIAPGGRLIVGNLSKEAGNLAYCEAVMDWWMITRSQMELESLSKHLPNKSFWTVKIVNNGCFNYMVADYLT